MFGVDERGEPAAGLGVGDQVQCEGGLAGRLRPVDLDDPTPRHSPDSERRVQRDRTGGNDVDANLRLLTHPHDRALAELAFDLTDGGFQCLQLLGLGTHETLLLRTQRGGTITILSSGKPRVKGNPRPPRFKIRDTRCKRPPGLQMPDAGSP